jgi:hypothetical protein
MPHEHFNSYTLLNMNNRRTYVENLLQLLNVEVLTFLNESTDLTSHICATFNIEKFVGEEMNAFQTFNFFEILLLKAEGLKIPLQYLTKHILKKEKIFFRNSI